MDQHRCSSCGKWVAAPATHHQGQCSDRGCPHRLTVWRRLAEWGLNPWQVRYIPEVVRCTVNHRRHPGTDHQHRAWSW